jgi:hypothetical protein
MKTNLQDTCIYVQGFTPFYDDGHHLCRLKKEFANCEYEGKWNECPNFKPIRQAWRDIKKMKY